jgi:hypothetical protein
MSDPEPTVSIHPFKLLHAYTGAVSIEEVLQNPRAARLLWLEILVNEELDLTAWPHHPKVQEAFQKACRWYTEYRTLVSALTSRTPLPPNPGPIDDRDYRTFAEALRFVAPHD